MFYSSNAFFYMQYNRDLNSRYKWIDKVIKCISFCFVWIEAEVTDGSFCGKWKKSNWNKNKFPS